MIQYDSEHILGSDGKHEVVQCAVEAASKVEEAHKAELLPSW